MENDVLKVYDEYRLVKLNSIDNKGNIWMKYRIRFRDLIINGQSMLNYTDKMNLNAISTIKDIFCWDNITNDDINIINNISKLTQNEKNILLE